MQSKRPSLARVPAASETIWQQQYRDSITNIGTLCKALDLQADQLSVSQAACRQFPLRVPWSYVERMQKSDPRDPLLLQVLPHALEEQESAGFGMDPVGDLSSVKSPGLLKKYHGRALLLATSRCAIHCRFCFRRHFPYALQNPRGDAWHSALNEIAGDPSIKEIILSGGDPLVLADREIAQLVDQLQAIPHVRRLRVHTRLPVVIPERINAELLDWIERCGLDIVVVVHVNHPRELDHGLREKLRVLSGARCHVLNQGVLLRDVNDDVDILVELSERLFDAGVLPYYLHLLDKVQGAMHFDVDEPAACAIMKEVAARLPGYLVPRLVREQAGEPGKTQVAFQADALSYPA